MRGIPRGGDGTDDHEAARPRQREPAVAADVTVPTAVVNFADSGEHRAARMPISREDRGYVLDHEDAAIAELAQQPAGCPFAFLFARGCRQQRALGCDGAGDLRACPCERLRGLGLGCAGTGDDQQPERIAGQAGAGSGGAGGVERVDVVIVAQPLLKCGMDCGQRRARRRLGWLWLCR